MRGQSGSAATDAGKLEQLRKEQRVSELVEELAGLGHWEWDELADRMAYCSPGLARLWGVTEEEYLRRASSPEDFMVWVHPEDRERYYATVFAEGVSGEFEIEYRTLRPDGEVLHVREVGVPLLAESGRLARTIGFVQDVTLQRRAEEALRRARDDLELRVADRMVELRKREALLRHAHEASNLGFWSWDPGTDLMTVSPEFARLLQLKEREEFSVRHDEFVARYVHPEDRARVLAESELPDAPGARFEIDFRIVRTDGEIRWVHEIGEVIADEHGQRLAEVGLVRDVTEQRESEAILRQAHKMEAVGQLTGGVAHSFNNLLTVVIGNLEISMERLRDGDEVEPFLQDALEGALRGADLTKQLLAFSGRQTIDSQVGDVNEAIRGMTGLLHRLLGPEFAIETDLCPFPCLVKFDPAQLRGSLVNLALNGCDAMAGGGTLRIETAPSTSEVGASGVRITVRDTGSGMPPEVEERALEPFYTTKGVGEGTGLGLSMVYGFVRRAGGELQIESARDVGTAVHMELPIIAAQQPVAVSAGDMPRAEESGEDEATARAQRAASSRP